MLPLFPSVKPLPPWNFSQEHWLMMIFPTDADTVTSKPSHGPPKRRIPWVLVLVFAPSTSGFSGFSGFPKTKQPQCSTRIQANVVMMNSGRHGFWWTFPKFSEVSRLLIWRASAVLGGISRDNEKWGGPLEKDFQSKKHPKKRSLGFHHKNHPGSQFSKKFATQMSNFQGPYGRLIGRWSSKPSPTWKGHWLETLWHRFFQVQPGHRAQQILRQEPSLSLKSGSLKDLTPLQLIWKSWHQVISCGASKWQDL